MSEHQILHGNNLVIKANGELLALGKSCTVDVQANTIPVSGPTTGQWEDNIPGRKGWEVTCSHLMYNRGATKPLDRMDMVGQIVELSLDIVYKEAIWFDGFVSGETIESGSVTVAYHYTDIRYDTINKLFLLRYYAGGGYKFYKNWNYYDRTYNPYALENIDDNQIYQDVANGSDAHEYYKANILEGEEGYNLVRRDTTRKGLAIVRQWSGTFTWGNLAQGSFRFLGKGALSPIE